MYGFDYGYEPATEGVASFFSAVMDKIREAGEKIKDWIDKVALKIKRFTNTTNAEQVRSDSADALKDIDEIGKNIVQILDGCNEQIDVLLLAWQKVGKSTTENDINYTEYLKSSAGSSRFGGTSTSTETKDGKPVYSRTSYEKSMSTPGGMDRISDEARKDSAKMTAWTNAKEKIAIELSKQKGLAEKTSAKLKGLAKYGPLTLKATKNGYDDLRAIFNANGQFGNSWKRVKVAAEWATGDIKNALNKVVAMYDVGIRATEAFGARLARGFVRDDNGEKMKKEDLKGVKGEYKNLNKIYKGNKSRSDISSKKDERAANLAGVTRDRSGLINDSGRFVAANKRLSEYEAGTDTKSRFGNGNESADYILERLYQVAYEDAKADIEYTQEALAFYDEMPGAYEFVEESADYEMGYDYDPLFDMV